MDENLTPIIPPVPKKHKLISILLKLLLMFSLFLLFLYFYFGSCYQEPFPSVGCLGVVCFPHYEFGGGLVCNIARIETFLFIPILLIISFFPRLLKIRWLVWSVVFLMLIFPLFSNY